MSNDIQIRFGALAPKLHVQLIVDEKDLELEQELADAMISCYIHGIITESEYQRVRNRLGKRVIGRLKEIRSNSVD